MKVLKKKTCKVSLSESASRLSKTNEGAVEKKFTVKNYSREKRNI
jgi:hypothetical protein